MKDFTPYNEALELKELGFDEDCFARYEGKITQIMKPLVIDFTFANLPRVENKVGYPNYPYPDVEAPTFSQAFRFFRDNFNLEPQVKSWKEKGGIVWHYSIQKIGEPSIFRSSDCAVDSHDKAQLICLQKLIQIVKDEKHTHTTNR